MRVLVYNTHVGNLLVDSPVGGWLKREFRPHLVLLQEVQRPQARQAARKLFPALTWSASGLTPKSTGLGAAGTVVFARRSVFRKLGAANPLVSRFMDRWHPERRTTSLVLRHRLWRLELVASSAHTWTQGETRNPQHRAAVLDGFRRQVDAYGKLAADALGADREAIIGGDWNAQVGDGGSYPETVMRLADLRSARPEGDDQTHLDELFLSSGLEVVRYQRVLPPFPGVEAHHQVLIVDVRPVRRRRA